MLLAGVLSTVQALLLVFIVGDGETTDAFLAAYSLYTPVALLGVSMRKSLVPLLGAIDTEQAFRTRANDLLSRVTVLALAGTAIALALAPVVSDLVFEGSAGAERVTLLALLLLIPAASLHVQAGSMSSVLNAVRRFPFSVGLYAGAAVLGVTGSAIFLLLFGVLGAGVGVFLGALALVAGHVTYLRRLGIRSRPRGNLLRGREARRLASYLFAGGAFAGAQQLSLPLALSAISGQHPAPGTITNYVYAYFLIGLVLRFSSTPLALVTLPNLVEQVARRGAEAARDHLQMVVPFMFATMVPLLMAFAAFGEPLLELLFGSVLPAARVRQLYELGLILELRAPFTALYLLSGSLVFAIGRSRAVLPVTLASVVVYGITAYALAPFGPSAVAGGHAAASAIAALLLLGAAFGRSLGSVVVRVGTRGAPAFILALPILGAGLATGPNAGLLVEAASLLLGLAAYAALVLLFWPTVRAPFLRLGGRLLRWVRARRGGREPSR